MRLKAFPITCSLLLTACGGAPIKPSVDLGVIDYPRAQVIENQTGGASISKINTFDKASHANVVKAIATGGQRVPLSTYDRAICFKPDSWNVEIAYVHSLERYISNHCSQPTN
jgi:hypothetical protein